MQELPREDLPRYEEMAKMLDEIGMEIPEEIYLGLNGGVIFSEETMYHPESQGEDLLVMGQYIQSPIGKTIVIYYGSFMKRFGYYPPDLLREELKKTLYHEFTHHLETMAGVKDLVIEDEIFMQNYREGKDR